ncbi:PhaM family polyhydroxyalkanoate granule multifunctional regulatory protein [Massilia cavernae]|uniref:PhaM family polyhydroxyalkanoate granule multifunctional regulatory protein n=1 Tax=Massilia cavernae TaxID=2320864 RepID=UPI001E579744|nr:PhaM family polyhydroxyalkanoate granule multifunctional regulatory protein [Massilia cavernae]
MAVPTLSVDDLDKKITDLKAVEAWLALNSSMVRGTIQTLEVQRGTLAALKSMGDAFAQAAQQPAPGAKDAGGDAAAGAFGNPAAWWNMLQEQFKQAVNTTMSPEAMSEAAAKMAAAMPTADMGKAMADSMAKAGAGAAAAAKGAAKPRAAKAKPAAE